jgi:hypothetical protein
MPADRSEQASIVADSAGVQIATSTGPQPAPLREDSGLTLDLRIGVTEGDERYQFHNVNEVAVHPSSGDIIVADLGSGVIRVFDADGQWVRTLGRRGSGPGETTRPEVITLLGDSIFAVTGSNYQAVVFDGSGRLVRQTPLTHTSGMLYPVGRSPDGWFVWAWSSQPGTQLQLNEIRVDSIEIQHVASLASAPEHDPDAGQATPVTTVRRGVRSMVINAGRGFGSAPLLWDAEPDYAADRRGFLYVTRGSPYQIDVFDTAGAWVRSIRRQVDPVPVTQAILDDYESRVIAFFDSASTEAAPLLRQIGLASLDAPIPSALPATRRLIVSTTGELLVERFDLSSDPVAPLLRSGRNAHAGIWDRFDGDGRFVGAVQLPARFSPLALQEHAIYGVLRDDFDVEFVVRYRLSR